MPTPLSFKGDKKSKKRKRVPAEDDSNEPASKALVKSANQDEPVPDDENVEDDSWVSADVISDISGPVVIVLPTSPPSCLACDANGKIFASELENMVEGNPKTSEPHDVRQVWIANRVAGMQEFNFKGHHGLYLGCDKFGVLSATKEAASQEETFSCIPPPESVSMFAIRTKREKYVAIEEKKEVTSTVVRGDSETIDFVSTFRIRMQARFKPKIKVVKEDKSFQKISRMQLQEAVGRTLTDEEVRRLKKSRKEGTYHETLVDVKMKSKHDKFA